MGAHVNIGKAKKLTTVSRIQEKRLTSIFSHHANPRAGIHLKDIEGHKHDVHAVEDTLKCLMDV